MPGGVHCVWVFIVCVGVSMLPCKCTFRDIRTKPPLPWSRLQEVEDEEVVVMEEGWLKMYSTCMV